MPTEEPAPNSAQASSVPKPITASQEPHPIAQSVQQSGKFGVNIGQGQGVHIGDVYQQADPETIKRIVREELRLPQREYGDPVGLGLNALAELMQYPVLGDNTTGLFQAFGDLASSAER